MLLFRRSDAWKVGTFSSFLGCLHVTLVIFLRGCRRHSSGPRQQGWRTSWGGEPPGVE
ncbi:unnamed protein product [Tetraodon nigroviridis]|uniref:(spotted green pufferfish) hypothetical protein n=1 Tax=Tetraodon nigroviridis TaxID=99883 RepID=Q4SW33_TETNG|nr:unnamed protein product [Tetraodon nigroviridis]